MHFRFTFVNTCDLCLPCVHGGSRHAMQSLDTVDSHSPNWYNHGCISPLLWSITELCCKLLCFSMSVSITGCYCWLPGMTDVWAVWCVEGGGAGHLQHVSVVSVYRQHWPGPGRSADTGHQHHQPSVMSRDGHPPRPAQTGPNIVGHGASTTLAHPHQSRPDKLDSVF